MVCKHACLLASLKKTKLRHRKTRGLPENSAQKQYVPILHKYHLFTDANSRAHQKRTSAPHSSEETRRHGTTGMAKFYKQPLQDLLQRAPKQSKFSNGKLRLSPSVRPMLCL